MSSFQSLRLTPREWEEYRRANPVRNSFRRPCRDDPKIKVKGYDETVSAAISASTNGEDYLEIQWTMFDTILWIMQRLEDKLMIPCKYWRLARNGMVLNPGFLPGGSSLFKHRDFTELLLVPVNVLKEQSNDDIGENEWRRLRPGRTNSSNPVKRAKALFHLINPEDSPHWNAYISHRQRAERQMQSDVLESFDGQNLNALLDQMKEGIDDVLCGPGTKVDGEEYDEYDGQDCLFDCIVPLKLDVTLDGSSAVWKGDITTRIYSPSRPTAIDVRFLYRRSRQRSAETFAELYFRTVDPISKEQDIMDADQEPERWFSLFNIRRTAMPQAHGSQSVEGRSFTLTYCTLHSLHRTLFGSSKSARLMDKLSLVELMFSAVGVPLILARDDCDEDAFGYGEVDWELDGAEWFGANIRRACGMPLVKDVEQWAPQI